MSTDRLSLQVVKGKRYLSFYSDHPLADHVTSLGFHPEKDDDGHIFWRKIFHPSLINQILNLFPYAVISSQLMNILHAYSLSNIVAINHHIIDNDKDLKDYQRDATRFIASRKRAMLALAPGLGKTLCALRAAQAAGYQRICIVTPLSLLYNWRNEIQRWLPDSCVGVFTTSSPWDIAGVGNRKIILTNYDYFKYVFYSSMFDLLIFDETILLKNRDTRRVRTVHDIIGSYQGTIWELTGGPTTKYLDDMWSQLNILDEKRFSSYWQFAHHYCIVEENQWGVHVIGNKPGAHDLLTKDIEDIYFARTQDQVLNLPDWIFERIDIPMDKEQEDIYEQMEKEFLASLPDGNNVLATTILTQLLRLVQIASNPSLLAEENDRALSAKWTASIELLQYCQKPVIIWTSFLKTARQLHARLYDQYQTDILTGEVPASERPKVIQRFQNGEIDVLIAHPGVGKFGHTLTAARTAIYLERGYNGDDFWQSLHRIRRIGTIDRPYVVYLRSTRGSKKTIDHVIDRVLEQKKESNNSIITARAIKDVLEGGEE